MKRAPALQQQLSLWGDTEKNRGTGEKDDEETGESGEAFLGNALGGELKTSQERQKCAKKYKPLVQRLDSQREYP